MTAVEFGDGREPYAVYRGRIRRYQHALVRDIAALPAPWRSELESWIESRGGPSGVVSLLVTRGEDGGDIRVHMAGAAISVALADLPAWLQRETPEPGPEPKPARASRTRRTAGGTDAGSRDQD